MIKKLFLSLILLGCASLLHAAQPVPVEQAFVLSTNISADQHSIIAKWQVAPGYHLYRDNFNFSITPANIAQLNPVTLPTGISKQDDILGKYQVYEKAIALNVNFNHLQTGSFTLNIRYQGCADNFCYPPVTKQIPLLSNGSTITFAPTSTTQPTTTEQDRVTKLLINDNWTFIILGFLGFGLLLAFTPCVLPMIPILSSIILGENGKITAMRGFTLSLAYVLAMAITYAAAGIIAGLAGSYVQAFFQNPWVLGVFCIVFVLLALSLFGLYELRLPNFLHHHVTNISNKQSSGSYIGVAVMGCLSTLIVSPCVTAPLIGALSYIGKTGNAFLGGTALFTMGIGMGIPLLIIGTLGGKFLPKAGSWMKFIKIIFGILLLAVAAMLLTRMHPLSANQTTAITLNSSQTIQVVKDLADTERLLENAKQQNKPALIDFYADWCIACKEMDKKVFSNPDVQRQLTNYVLIRADLTSNNEGVKALAKHFNIIAPPSIIFFDPHGNEIPNSRIVGAVSAREFLNHIH